MTHIIKTKFDKELEDKLCFKVSHLYRVNSGVYRISLNDCGAVIEDYYYRRMDRTLTLYRPEGFTDSSIPSELVIEFELDDRENTKTILDTWIPVKQIVTDSDRYKDQTCIYFINPYMLSVENDTYSMFMRELIKDKLKQKAEEL